MRGVAGARIWYQSFSDPDADRAYFTRLEAYLGSVASPGCQVEVFGIQPSARYPGLITDLRCQPPHGLPPGEAITEFRAAFTTLRSE
ncbi:MAG: hypothetical protein ACRDP5_07110 [Streptosporangiaceae bacterium]